MINADLHWLIRFMVNGFMRPAGILRVVEESDRALFAQWIG